LKVITGEVYETRSQAIVKYEKGSVKREIKLIDCNEATINNLF
jgi:hypothetical protein